MDLINFYEFGVKDTIRMSGVPDNLLHVLIGCALLVLIAAALRRPLSCWIPLASVAAIELLNECADRVRWDSWLGWGTPLDIALTLALPLLLFLIANHVGRAQSGAASLRLS